MEQRSFSFELVQVMLWPSSLAGFSLNGHFAEMIDDKQILNTDFSFRCIIVITANNIVR